MGRPSVGVVFTSKIREWLKTGLLQVRPEQQELRHHALGSGSFSHDTTRNVVVGIDMRACFASRGSMQALWSEFFWLPSCSRQSFILSPPPLSFPHPQRRLERGSEDRAVGAGCRDLGAVSRIRPEGHRRGESCAGEHRRGPVYSGAKLCPTGQREIQKK